MEMREKPPNRHGTGEVEKIASFPLQAKKVADM